MIPGARTTHIPTAERGTVAPVTGERSYLCRSSSFAGDFAGITWAPGRAAPVPWHLLDALPEGVERIAGDTAGGR